MFDAIQVENLSQRYKLYPSKAKMAIDLFGMTGLFFPRANYPTKLALNNVSFAIRKGERVGIIGRNGAGKTTLLKIISGLVPVQEGNVRVNGRVNILMTSGLGFHPEMSGLDNVKNSLILNGIENDQLAAAVEDVVGFCELGEYINQPLKTYSLGMTSRLAFATSTAIKPEILIIDEILGSGDAYFLAKSAKRIKDITDSKETTLLLVSHSNSQILKFCERCIWLDQGTIVEDGPSLDIVKKYDKKIVELSMAENVETASQPVSRWHSRYDDFQIKSFRIADSAGIEKNIFYQGDDIVFEMSVANKYKAKSEIFPVLFIYDLHGTIVTFKWERFESTDTDFTVKLKLLNQKLGKGQFVISVGLYKTLDLYDLNNSEYFDNIDRSYSFKILLREPYQDPSLVNLESEWSI